ncbi:cytochrome P450 [Irpex rosettiformis]|uniref:Cytochrome P450 n=1 Tax=Irpex rosettiformis TaxID=378272 RepID=A0ACB8UBZ9_9APHY|nr:cytochrome P450 [Irpex rosettiformis]
MSTVAAVGPAFVALAAWLAWKLYRVCYAKSPLDNIPGPPSTSFWKGNIGSLFHRHAWDYHDELMRKYGSVVKFNGLFNRRALYVYDPLALQHIILKDQDVFEQPYWFVDSNHIIFGPSLLATLGEHHRKQRKLLNPVFSIAHLRQVTPVFYQIVHRLHAALEARVTDSPTEIDMLHWMNRTALELIGQGGFDHSFDSLIGEEYHGLREAIKELVPTAWALTPFRMISPVLRKLGPPRFQRWLAEMWPNPHVQRALYIIDTLEKTSRQVYHDKKAALQKGDKKVIHQIAEGKDIMSRLLKANVEVEEEERLSEEELVAQVSTLCFAATDTTSSALARILHLLAQHPETQDKLREEIKAARHGNDIPYDQLVELPYLDAICRETLRLYPPSNLAAREAHRDIFLPLSTPIIGNDGEVINEIFVPNGSYIMVANRASNRNKATWGGDADKWKPERWLSPLPESVVEAKIPGVYSHQMTFGGGGRSCIGFKFSQLEMKVALSVLLESFKFSLSDKEITWNFASPAYPTLGPTSTKASLSLLVGRM